MQLYRRYGDITVWVDAICINQDNVDEKADQIKLIADIYSQARFVVVWLGDGTAQTSRVIDCFTSSWRFGSTALTNIRKRTRMQWLADRIMRRYICK